MYTQDTVFFGAFSHPLIPAVSRFKDRFVRVRLGPLDIVRRRSSTH